MALSLWIVAGSALGGLARYWMSVAVAMLAGVGFPWGTLLINVLGSLVIGLVGASTNAQDHANLRAFLMVGVCGGFTTFSSFSLQTLELLQGGRVASALAYIGLSAVVCLLAVWAGWSIGRPGWV